MSLLSYLQPQLDFALPLCILDLIFLPIVSSSNPKRKMSDGEGLEGSHPPANLIVRDAASPEAQRPAVMPPVEVLQASMTPATYQANELPLRAQPADLSWHEILRDNQSVLQTTGRGLGRRSRHDPGPTTTLRRRNFILADILEVAAETREVALLNREILRLSDYLPPSESPSADHRLPHDHEFSEHDELERRLRAIQRRLQLLRRVAESEDYTQTLEDRRRTRHAEVWEGQPGRYDNRTFLSVPAPISAYQDPSLSNTSAGTDYFQWFHEHPHTRVPASRRNSSTDTSAASGAPQEHRERVRARAFAQQETSPLLSSRVVASSPLAAQPLNASDAVTVEHHSARRAQVGPSTRVQLPHSEPPLSAVSRTRLPSSVFTSQLGSLESQFEPTYERLPLASDRPRRRSPGRGDETIYFPSLDRVQGTRNRVPDQDGANDRFGFTTRDQVLYDFRHYMRGRDEGVAGRPSSRHTMSRNDVRVAMVQRELDIHRARLGSMRDGQDFLLRGLVARLAPMDFTLPWEDPDDEDLSGPQLWPTQFSVEQLPYGGPSPFTLTIETNDHTARLRRVPAMTPVPRHGDLAQSMTRAGVNPTFLASNMTALAGTWARLADRMAEAAVRNYPSTHDPPEAGLMGGISLQATRDTPSSLFAEQQANDPDPLLTAVGQRIEDGPLATTASVSVLRQPRIIFDPETLSAPNDDDVSAASHLDLGFDDPSVRALWQPTVPLGARNDAVVEEAGVATTDEVAHDEEAVQAELEGRGEGEGEGSRSDGERAAHEEMDWGETGLPQWGSGW